MKKYDVIVIGGGHAGYEGATASARTGAETLVLTQNISTIGELSCNPSIGGQAKSNLVREIDIFGGIMGKAADFSAIHYKTLNRSKGPAVHATRSQNDRGLYCSFVRNKLFSCSGLSVFQTSVRSIEAKNEKTFVISTSIGVSFLCSTVVVAAGTFLNGTVTTGSQRFSAGRLGEPASKNLASCIKSFGHRIFRLKTGTPPRLLMASLDFKTMDEQKGETDCLPFSIQTSDMLKNQRSCYITRTNKKTHQIIRENIHKSPIYGTHKSVEGIGPRYCPSIEDKIIKFSDKPAHTIFIEPEAWDAIECYPNGISTSLPCSVQEEFIRSVPGLEKAVITRPGYAIEYDAFDPVQLKNTLESTLIPGFFMAGQINGTSGYEEAGIQGLVAGVNAALISKNSAEVFTLDRTSSYGGVLIDDITGKGTSEPYRLFTSRAEYRLFLREDNTSDRLLEQSVKFNLISPKTAEKERGKTAAKRTLISLLSKKHITPEKKLTEHFAEKNIPPPKKKTSLKNFLKRPDIAWEDVEVFLDTADFDKKTIENALTEIVYEDFLKRQEEEIEKHKKMKNISIPESLDVSKIPGLTRETIEKLHRYKPENLARFAAIPGITPAAVSVLLLYIKKHLS
ncbi:MAG: tRNA uridine-5-carboxymethylaminomethyl(34) synthesis enzyme MnmG [bacterium]